MFERFTDQSRRVLVLAQEEALLLNHNFIGSEHILLGLIREEDGYAARALRSLGIGLASAREKVAETVGPAGTSTTGSPPFTPRAKKVLELSLREALQHGHNYIGTEHMLLGLVREGEGVAVQVLVSTGNNLAEVRLRVLRVMVAEATGPSEDLLAGASELEPPEPRCPGWSRRLADNVGTKAFSVSPPEDEPDAEPRRVTFLYCLQCGTALGTLT
jgi:ATP-dependent Clp protease ATP-binding subunit ClpC